MTTVQVQSYLRECADALTIPLNERERNAYFLVEVRIEHRRNPHGDVEELVYRLEADRFPSEEENINEKR